MENDKENQCHDPAAHICLKRHKPDIVSSPRTVILKPDVIALTIPFMPELPKATIRPHIYHHQAKEPIAILNGPTSAN